MYFRGVPRFGETPFVVIRHLIFSTFHQIPVLFVAKKPFSQPFPFGLSPKCYIIKKAVLLYYQLTHPLAKERKSPYVIQRSRPCRTEKGSS